MTHLVTYGIIDNYLLKGHKSRDRHREDRDDRRDRKNSRSRSPRDRRRKSPPSHEPTWSPQAKKSDRSRNRSERSDSPKG